MNISAFDIHFSPALASAPVQFKHDYKGVLNLKSNELYHPRLNLLFHEFLSDFPIDSIRHYPYFPETTEFIAKQMGLESNQVLLTAGSDDGIRMIINTLAATTGKLVLLNPVYANYKNYAQGVNLQIQNIDFTSDSLLLALEQLIDKLAIIQPSTVVLTNPNGFSGEIITKEILEEIAETSAQYSHILVIDEVYSAFSDCSHSSLLDRFDHLILIQSYSKAYAAAGLRLGQVVSSSKIIDYLSRWKPSNPVNTFSLNYLNFCISHQKDFTQIWHDIATCRQWLCQSIKSSRPNWNIPISGANFILIDFGDTMRASQVSARLEHRGILVRSFPDQPEWCSCLRITICPEARDLILNALLEEDYTLGNICD